MTAVEGHGRVRAALEERIDPKARPRMAVHRAGAMTFLEARLPGAFRALFSTRLGGVSEGPFASLNLDPRSEDDLLPVQRNRDQVAGALHDMELHSPELQVPPRHRLLSPVQVHGLRVVGAAEYERDHPGNPCDGLTLHPLLDKGITALLLFADCVPIVLAGEVDMAVAHGGWRGILGGIVQQAGRAMTGPPATAVIGPSIGPCCFTVGDEVAEAFAARFGPSVVVGAEVPLAPGARGARENPRVDLWAATTLALAEQGVREEQVVNPKLCTACNVDLFYSYRLEGPVTGRHGCLAWAAA